MTLVRVRFFLVLGAALAIVAIWPLLRAWWDKLTRPAQPPEGAKSLDTEYWCPMCPGVLSDWPGKCPVCNMALVRRKKGEPVPQPDGVLARMQLSPYRVQLAGIQTSPLDYLPLVREVTLTGLAAAPGTGGAPATTRTWVRAEALEPDLALLREGQAAHLTADSLAGRPPLNAHVRRIGPAVNLETRTAPVWLETDASPEDLRPGALVIARVEVPAAQQDWCRRAFLDEWLRSTTTELTVHSLLRPATLPDAAGAQALLRLAAPCALLQRGLVAAVPETAVINHGPLEVVYVETMPGMFDGMAVTLGPRCGDYYPVLAGLSAGQRVATAGAFLLDAEARLSPSLAIAYFGASRSGSSPPPVAAPATAPSTDDHELIARQKVCPVTGNDLDSMGGPVRVEVNGRVVFICCEGCEAKLRKDPGKYLSKLPGK
jgi:Cu(I)/Ag(I) efflux system membrane fusion protein